MAAPLIAAKIGNSLLNTSKGFMRAVRGSIGVGAEANARFKEKIEDIRAKEKKENIKQERIEKAVKEEMRRRQREGEIEVKRAPLKLNLVENIIKKPMQSFWYIVKAWLIDNLPRIIKEVKIFIKKVRVFIKSFNKTLGNIGGVFSSMIGIVGAVINNVKNFDFTDKSGELENARKDFDTAILDLKTTAQETLNVWNRSEAELDEILEDVEKGQSLEEALRNITGDYSGAREEEQPQSDSAAQPQTPLLGGGGANVNGTGEEYRIAAAVATEAGRGVSATDVLQVAANRVADSRYPNTFTDVFAQPRQFQGVFDRGLNRYRNIQTAEDAAAFSGRSVETINGYVADLRNADLRANSAKQIGGALEFRAAPQYYQQRPGERPSGTGADGRIPGSSWRGGRGDNQILIDPSQDPMRAGGAAPITYNQGTATQAPASSQGTNTQAPMPAGTGSDALIDKLTAKDFNTMNYSAPSPIIKTSLRGMRNGRHHAGIDFGTGGERNWYCAYNSNGKVTFVGPLSGYGKTVIIKFGNVELLFAHLARYGQGIRNGATYTGGSPIGEVGETGVGSGIHLHFEARTVGGGGGSDIDPNPYVNNLIFGRLNPNPKKSNQADLKTSAKVSSVPEKLEGADKLASMRSTGNKTVVRERIIKQDNYFVTT